MFCANCGKEIIEGQPFCANCGSAVQVVQPSPTQTTQESAPTLTLEETAEQLPKAGFWIRVLATLIDVIFLGIIGFILGGIAGGVIGAVLGSQGFSTEEIMSVASTAGGIIGTCLNIFYYVFCIGSWGQTFGKYCVGIKVITVQNTPVSYFKAFVRYIGYIVSFLTLCIGYLMITWDKNKQGLHDKIVGTYVIKIR